jgi:hypothetical protein
VVRVALGLLATRCDEVFGLDRYDLPCQRRGDTVRGGAVRICSVERRAQTLREIVATVLARRSLWI